jgi:hypothetical protein
LFSSQLGRRSATQTNPVLRRKNAAQARSGKSCGPALIGVILDLVQGAKRMIHKGS